MSLSTWVSKCTILVVDAMGFIAILLLLLGRVEELAEFGIGDVLV